DKFVVKVLAASSGTPFDTKKFNTSSSFTLMVCAISLNVFCLDRSSAYFFKKSLFFKVNFLKSSATLKFSSIQKLKSILRSEERRVGKECRERCRACGR